MKNNRHGKSRIIIILLITSVFFTGCSYDVRDSYYFPQSSYDVKINNPWCEINLKTNEETYTFVLDVFGRVFAPIIVPGDVESICFTIPKGDIHEGNVVPICKLNMWHFCQPYTSGYGHITKGKVRINKVFHNRINIHIEFPDAFDLHRFKASNTFKLNTGDISKKNYEGLIRLTAEDEVVNDDVEKFLQEASETEFGHPLVGCIETIEVAEKAGVDYKQVLEGCLARNTQSMQKMFWVSKNAGFDAASAQGHATVLGMLLRKLGDEYFGEYLSKEKKEIQESVRDYLLYDLGYGNIATLEEIAKTYPKTFPGFIHSATKDEMEEEE